MGLLTANLIFNSLNLFKNLLKIKIVLDEAPYLAQVRNREDYGFRDNNVCGGALITER